MTLTLDGPAAEQIEARLALLGPTERAVAEARLGRHLTRRRALAKFRTPTELAQALGGPGITITPMLRMFDSVLVSAEAGFRTRWIINTPPQETKTTTLNQWGALWLLLRDPSRRIGIASYEQGIAARSGLAVKQLIEAHGSGYSNGRDDPDRHDELGLLLDSRRSQSTAWSLSGVHGENGGMLSVGIGSALTGRALNVLIIDDPLKDAEQADSLVYRERVKNWYQSVATTRLSGHTIVIVVQTRWHEDDLSGWLMARDDARAYPQWSRLVVPAQAEDNDPLGRAPGAWLESVQGRTAEEWEGKKEEVGTRWWYAMYQQRPSPPTGGVFQREWFDRHRVKPGQQPELVYSGVWVDPADNAGTGDECGLIYAGLGADGRVYVVEDASGHMTVHQMLRRALLICTRRHGHVVRLEKSLSGLKRNAEKAWRDVRWEAGILQAHWRAAVRARGQQPEDVPWPVEPDPEVLAAAVAHIARDDDGPLARADIESALGGTRTSTDDEVTRLGLWPLVPAVLALPQSGPPVTIFQAKGSKSWRASNASPPYERGQVSHVGPKARAEHQMASWQQGQDSPDRMDAIVHAVTELSAKAGGADIQKDNTRIPQRTHGGVVRIPRSTTSARR